MMDRTMNAGLLSILSVIMGMFLQTPPAEAVEVPSVGLEVGQMYPDFLLPNIDGGMGRLSDFRGKKVLLIHFASW